MQDLEEHIKEATAEVVARNFGTKTKFYLDYRNYRDKKKKKERFQLKSIINTLAIRAKTSGKDPILYYREKYGDVPPWILFKSAYFSDIVNFIDLFKPKQQAEIAKYIYDFPTLNSDMPTEIAELRSMMMDTLYVCLEYRNLSAHGGRVYCHHTNYDLRSKLNKESNFQGFNLLLYLLSYLKYKAPYTQLKTNLDIQLTRHCREYPHDVTYLSNVLKTEILIKEIK